MKFVTADSSPEGTAARSNQRARRGQSTGAARSSLIATGTGSMASASLRRAARNGNTRDAATPSRTTSAT
jgi:hypothetical protein